jgi:hypothetical protein
VVARHDLVLDFVQQFPLREGFDPDHAGHLRCSLDLGQDHYAARPRFRLIRGEGPMEETLACFQMLAAELELPFRRDGVEKILRDVLRRGQTPDLQLCGNLAAMLGLHVSSATIPAAFGNRLQAPALVPWKQGFALLRASNAAGMQLASPSEGDLLIATADIEEAFPEGIPLLMVERSAQTPEQRFGPSWFLPALRRRRGRPLFIIDIAVPRDVDPLVHDIEGVYLYDIDALEALASETRQRRENEITQCLAIIEENIGSSPLFRPHHPYPPQRATLADST